MIQFVNILSESLMSRLSRRDLIKRSSKALREKAPSQHDALSQLEVDKIELDSKKSHLKNLDLKNQELEHLIALRKSYADKILWLSVFWFIITIFFVMASGFSWWNFSLSSKVLVAMVGSSIGNVLSLAMVVAKGIFYKN